VLISLAFIVSNPIVRQLYNNTIDGFPGAFLLLISATLVVAGFGNFAVYANQESIRSNSVSA
jgi:hypothetical protein